MTTPVRQYEQGDRICRVDNCGRPRGPHGTYCQMHWQRFRRHGDAGEAERMRSPVGQSVWNTKEYRRNYRRRINYNLTPSEYDKMLKDQDYRCRICRTDDPKTARIGTWIVDHDHTTGKVRGLLCASCNRALGLFQDSPVIIAQAVQYLLQFQAAPVVGD